jgi:hypothetical protein
VVPDCPGLPLLDLRSGSWFCSRSADVSNMPHGVLSSKVVLLVMLAVEKSGKELLRWEITEFIAVAKGSSFSSVLIHCWVVVCGVVPEKQ